MSTEEIRVRGTVQGVGFRPTVYRLAKAYGLQGEVCNDGQGVLIRASGREESIEEFVQKLQKECPPLARIDEVTRKRYEGKSTFDDFVISHSVSSGVTTEVPPDAATCPKCKAEIFDPLSRWYRYPFTNCTHCGPRLSIIRAIPYDRRNTSMATFAMCTECSREYNDVANRRFHAQRRRAPCDSGRAYRGAGAGDLHRSTDCRREARRRRGARSQRQKHGALRSSYGGDRRHDRSRGQLSTRVFFSGY